MQSLYGAKAALPLLRRAYEGSADDYWYRYAVAAYENGLRSVALKVIADMEKRQPKDLDVLELHEQILRHEAERRAGGGRHHPLATTSQPNRRRHWWQPRDD